MTSIVWEDPPSSHVSPTGRVRWRGVLDEIRSRPGEWARLPRQPMTWTEAHDLTQYLRRGGRGTHDVNGFEFVRRRLPDSTDVDFGWAVYARFTTPQET